MAVDREKALKRLGRSLAECRREAKMTQEELAEASGLNSKYISDVERGVKNPTAVTLLMLADGLGISASSLFRKTLG